MIYECKPCNFNTSIKCHYIRHIATNKHKYNVSPSNNDTKKYVCKKCNKQFTTSSNLSRHEAVCIDITKNKDILQCMYCKEVFSHKNNYYRHVKHRCKKNLSYSDLNQGKGSNNVHHHLQINNIHNNIYMMKPIDFLNKFYSNNPSIQDIVSYATTYEFTKDVANKLQLASKVNNLDFISVELDGIMKDMNKKFIEETNIYEKTCDSILFINDGSIRRYITRNSEAWIYSSDDNVLDTIISTIFDNINMRYDIHINYIKKERAEIIKKIKQNNDWNTEKSKLMTLQ